MKKTIIFIIALCLLLCSCEKTLSSVTSPDMTLTKELEKVYASGGKVTADELFALKSIEILETTELYWNPETCAQISIPGNEEGLKPTFPAEYEDSHTKGSVPAVKYRIIDDGIVYRVFGLVTFGEDETTITIFKADNEATGEIFYDESAFE